MTASTLLSGATLFLATSARFNAPLAFTPPEMDLLTVKPRLEETPTPDPGQGQRVSSDLMKATCKRRHLSHPPAECGHIPEPLGNKKGGSTPSRQDRTV